jgi:hypothetical protein
MASARTFTAQLERDGTALNWVVARIPFDVAKAWPQRRGHRVRGFIEDYAFRTTLVAYPYGGGFVLVVNRKMLAGARVRVGERVRLTLEPDLEERPAEAPPELADELKTDRALKRWYERLSPSMRREIAKWITEPKSPESRLRRAAKMADRLLLAMEGERQPPPVLRALFQRRPQARAAWDALTPTQRRLHLLGIFYYETPEARERRASKAIEEAMRAAQKRVRAGK